MNYYYYGMNNKIVLITGRGDLGNGHNYPVNGAQPVRNYNYKNDLYSSINGYKGWTSASNFVITEFGYLPLFLLFLAFS